MSVHSLIVAILFFDLRFVATKECYQCFEEKCQNPPYQLETCASTTEVCVTWRYRKSNPLENVRVGDVFKRGCAQVLVAIEGCTPNGKYDRCICRTDHCNDVNFAVYTTTTPRPRVTANSNKSTGQIVKDKNTTTAPFIPSTTEPVITQNTVLPTLSSRFEATMTPPTEMTALFLEKSAVSQAAPRTIPHNFTPITEANTTERKRRRKKGKKKTVHLRVKPPESNPSNEGVDIKVRYSLKILQ